MPAKTYIYLLLLLVPGIQPALAAELASFEVSSGEIRRERLFDGVVEAIHQNEKSFGQPDPAHGTGRISAK